MIRRCLPALVLLVLSCAGSAAQQPPRQSAPATGGPTIPYKKVDPGAPGEQRQVRVRSYYPRGWSNRLYDGYLLAVQRNQPMLVYFLRQDCEACARATREIDESATFRHLHDQAVLLAVDPSQDEDTKDNVALALKAWEIKAYPTFILLTPRKDNVQERGRVSGYVRAGTLLDDLAAMAPELWDALDRERGTWIGWNGIAVNRVQAGTGFLTFAFKCGGTDGPSLSVQLPHDRQADPVHGIGFRLTVRSKASGGAGPVAAQEAGTASVPLRTGLNGADPWAVLVSGARAVTLARQIATAAQLSLAIDGTKPQVPTAGATLAADIPLDNAGPAILGSLKFCSL